MKKPHKIKHGKLEDDSIESIENYIRQNYRRIISFDSRDKIETEPPFLVEHNDKVYSFELEEGECVESTWEHTIFEWDIINLIQIK